MSILDFDDGEALGHVQSVDTTVVIVRVDDVSSLRKLQVNRLVALQSSRSGHKLIGIINKITRTALEDVKLADIEAGTGRTPNSTWSVSC